LSGEKILWLSEKHEIGSHGFSHLDLAKVPLPTACRELKMSKAMLDDLLPEKAIEGLGFSYPIGSCTRRVKHAAKFLSYSYARTISSFSISVDTDPYVLKITLPFYCVKLLDSLIGAFGNQSIILYRSIVACDVSVRRLLSSVFAS
jgi:peptidoglycan/xylan/chitin deacetylase (PgdA/CDA1 family)